MKHNVRVRDSCRLCCSSSLKLILEFESIPFFDEIVTSGNRGREFSYPMRVYICQDCMSLQSLHDIDLHAYYESYNYVPSESEFVTSYMQSLVQYCSTHFDLRQGSTVLEVGASDGYLLELFRDAGSRVIGFEPAINLCEIARARGVELIPDLFHLETVNMIPPDRLPVDFCVLLHTFDHLHDPTIFLETLGRVLDPENGVLVLEVHDLADIVERFETSLFGHEHATYLHLGSIDRLLRRHGFRVIEANFLPRNTVRGSSMLVAAVPLASSRLAVEGLEDMKASKLESLSTYESFAESVSLAFANIRRFVFDSRQEGKILAAYGGWGRGVTSLAMAGLGPKEIKFVIDSNERLHGKYTPVSSIPIVSPAEVSRVDVDIIIVFNHAYMEDIAKTMKEFLNKGGVLISVLELLKPVEGAHEEA